MLPTPALQVQDATLLSPLFSDGMVLQRERPVPVFGTDRPGAAVTVRLNGRTARARADREGRWTALLPKMAAGGPYEMTVEGTATRRVADVLVGEVWVCGGQSNMEWTIDAGTDMQGEKANPPREIRQFSVEKNAQAKPTRDLRGRWVVASPETLGGFTAVGYGFAKSVYDRLHIPIGLLSSNWGGTSAEAWTTLETLAGDPVTKPLYDRYAESMAGYPAALERYRGEIAAAQAKAFPEFDAPGESAAWAGADFDDSGWPTVKLPHLFPGDLDGVVWYRMTFDLPADRPLTDLALSLGAVDDADVTYVNGRQVGRTDLTVPGYYSLPRVYTVPKEALRPGRNVVAVRVFDFGGAGGFTAPPPGGLRIGDRPLTEARTRLERRYASDPRGGASFPQPPVGPGDPNLPSALMNGMIDPLLPYAIRGAVWYQGENNAGRSEQYRTLFPMMIRDWRRKWRPSAAQRDFPFYWVSLAAFMERHDDGRDSAWAELRDAQRETLSLPNTGTALAIDLGEADNIHPRRKREVGRRLALNALAKTYGLPVEYAGPEPVAVEAQGGLLRVRYRHAAGLRTADGAAPAGFAIAGADGVYHRATAALRGEAVVLTAPEVPAPRTVRYAWADNPDVNLQNGDGLPAMPFRTDTKDFATKNAR